MLLSAWTTKLCATMSWKQKTQENKWTAVNACISALGDRNLDEYKGADFLELRQSLKGKSDFTIGSYMTNLKTIFGLAAQYDSVSSNPLAKIRVPVCRVDLDGRRHISEAEVKRVMAAAPRGLPMLIALCFYAGLRRGEALRLEWPDVCLKENWLRVRHQGTATTKGRTRRARLELPLRKLLTLHRQTKGLVCSNLPSRLTDSLNNACFGAGVSHKEFTYQRLRSSRSTIWSVDNELPDTVLNAMLGNSAMVRQRHYNTPLKEIFTEPLKHADTTERIKP